MGGQGIGKDHPSHFCADDFKNCSAPIYYSFSVPCPLPPSTGLLNTFLLVIDFDILGAYIKGLEHVSKCRYDTC
jgi:hypothetical protein